MDRCSTCNEPYSRDPVGRAMLCSNGFHMCRDCTWREGRLVARCAHHARTEAPAPAPTSLGADGHALSRYIERWHPSMHPRDARLRLEEAMMFADFVELEDGTDQSIWRTPEGALLVVNSHGVVKTVLPRDAAKRHREGARPDTEA